MHSPALASSFLEAGAQLLLRWDTYSLHKEIREGKALYGEAVQSRQGMKI